MMIKTIATTLIANLFLGSIHAQDPAGAFVDACAKALAKELPDGQRGIPGADADWYFLDKEIAHLATGQFWTKDYATTTQSKTDPAPIIIDYHEKLKALGIELLLVPIPPKASIYPEKFSTAGRPAALAPFYEQLTKAGVSVIDLEPVFQAERKANPDKLLYCERDSHYSPYATQFLANLIHEKYQDSDWAKAIQAQLKFVTAEEKEVTINGELVPGKPEKVSVVEVNNSDNEQIFPDDPTSPIVLLGDSHTKVFSTGGELHWKAAGLPDHLQAKFGTRLHLVAKNGSGSHQARIGLFQKGRSNTAYWESKKLIIWVFSAREFTQESKWAKIPVKI